MGQAMRVAGYANGNVFGRGNLTWILIRVAATMCGL
jgi:hypothetical protein